MHAWERVHELRLLLDLHELVEVELFVERLVDPALRVAVSGLGFGVWSHQSVSLNLRLKDPIGPVTRANNKKKSISQAVSTWASTDVERMSANQNMQNTCGSGCMI